MPECCRRAPLGILGGTFDPVHFGHLRLAQEALEFLGLSGVCWIPAGRPCLRDEPAVTAAHRLAMARLAIDGNAHFTLDAAEVATDQPSYTVLTLERLREETAYGSALPLVLLLGADAFSGLARWHHWERLFDLAHIAVAHRAGRGISPENLPPPLAAAYRRRFCEDCAVLANAPGGAIVQFPITPLDISATAIRALLAAGKSPRYLLPQRVIEYIEQHHFYSENPVDHESEPA